MAMAGVAERLSEARRAHGGTRGVLAGGTRQAPQAGVEQELAELLPQELRTRIPEDLDLPRRRRTLSVYWRL